MADSRVRAEKVQPESGMPCSSRKGRRCSKVGAGTLKMHKRQLEGVLSGHMWYTLSKITVKMMMMMMMKMKKEDWEGKKRKKKEKGREKKEGEHEERRREKARKKNQLFSVCVEISE